MPSPNDTTNTTVSKIAVRFGDSILQEGFTSVPNLVLNHYAKLGISPAEMLFTVHIWQHWWTERDPYPSLQKIAERMGVGWRQAHRYASSLKQKGYLNINQRQESGQGQITSEYDFEPLLIAVVELVRGESRTPLSNQSGGGLTKMTGEPLSKIAYEEDEVKEDPNKEDIYPSKTRKAKNEKNDYVNPVRTAGNPSTLEHPPAAKPQKDNSQEKVVEKHEGKDGLSEESTNPSNNRNESKPPQPQPRSPVREKMHNPQPRSASPGLMSIGDLLQQQGIPTAVADDEAKDAIREYIRDMRGQLHDEASLEHSTTRAFNLYQRAGIDLGSFFNRIHDAEQEAKRRSTTITKRRADGFINRMPYFFSVLEDKLHLRPKDPQHRPQRA